MKIGCLTMNGKVPIPKTLYGTLYGTLHGVFLLKMLTFRGYPDAKHGIGSCLIEKINFGQPFEPIVGTNKYIKSVHQKLAKKEQEVAIEIEKTVVNKHKRERSGTLIQPEIQDWIDHFKHLGENGSVGLVPASFQNDFLNSKGHKIKWEENDVIKTVQHFFIYNNKTKKSSI
jgi:hypothetical protein